MQSTVPKQNMTSSKNCKDMDVESVTTTNFTYVSKSIYVIGRKLLSQFFQAPGSVNSPNFGPCRSSRGSGRKDDSRAAELLEGWSWRITATSVLVSCLKRLKYFKTCMGKRTTVICIRRGCPSIPHSELRTRTTLVTKAEFLKAALSSAPPNPFAW